jgi:hypothetical protein
MQLLAILIACGMLIAAIAIIICYLAFYYSEMIENDIDNDDNKE